MIAFLFILIAFLCGSLPFSVWLGKGLLHLDVRRFGDGNPGAFNVFRAGNKLLGFVALILDVSKAAAPVGLAYFTMGIRGAPMFFIAVVPILGHAFSPFLGFRGGKALATALGVWIGLNSLEGFAGGGNCCCDWHCHIHFFWLGSHACVGRDFACVITLDTKPSFALGISQ